MYDIAKTKSYTPSGIDMLEEIAALKSRYTFSFHVSLRIFRSTRDIDALLKPAVHAFFGNHLLQR